MNIHKIMDIYQKAAVEIASYNELLISVTAHQKLEPHSDFVFIYAMTVS